MIDPTHEAQETVWDVVVIGTGAGGATAGLNLARLGRSVLFLERGTLAAHGEGAAGSMWRSLGVLRRTARGDVRWPMPMSFGAGGSTAIFGMAMERFRPVDLHPEGLGSDLSAARSATWPIQYSELLPYYQQAETLFRVRGTEDPLCPSHGALLDPPLMSAAEAIVHRTLGAAGLHPYRLHVACEKVAGCTGCFATACPHPCRNDAGRMCLVPALTSHRARIVAECRVVRLAASGRVVREAICDVRGTAVRIRAKVFVLALNALFTPALLLRSANDSFPDGLGNASRLVGRNLMLHVSESLRVEFAGLRDLPGVQLNHGISLNDFYTSGGAKLGNVHAHSWHTSQGEDSRGGLLFHTIVEDFPRSGNRVLPRVGSDQEVCWEYHEPPELLRRAKQLSDAFSNSVRASCGIRILPAASRLNASHVCGTCRFGTDPRTSVLDRNNRIHDLDNVYVVDASFFPSSGGIHPSLTIVANSLRVSELIVTR